MIRNFRKFFFAALYFTGLGHIVKYYNTKNYLVPILLFHRVSDETDQYWPPLPTKAFEKIVRFISDKYTVRPIKDLFEHTQHTLKGSCFIVFDDAYRDFLENALPILREKNMPVTMFVPVESIDTGKPIWTTWLNICIDQSKAKRITTESDHPVVYEISDLSSKIRTAHALTVWLKSLPYDKFKSEFNKIMEQLGDEIKNPVSVMSWTEIRATREAVDYQSHTMSHPMLGNIDRKDVLDYEIANSKKRIEQEIEERVTCISYPIGSYSASVMEKAGEYYNAAFAVDENLVNLKKLNDTQYRYKIPRFNIYDSDPYELFFRINGFHKLLGR